MLPLNKLGLSSGLYSCLEGKQGLPGVPGVLASWFLCYSEGLRGRSPNFSDYLGKWAPSAKKAGEQCFKRCSLAFFEAPNFL
jgi:hypothetical protein